MRHIAVTGSVGKALLPILRGLAANTKTVDRTVACGDDFPLDSRCECIQIRFTTGSRSHPSTFVTDYVYSLKCPEMYTSPDWPVCIASLDPILLHSGPGGMNSA